MSRRTSSSSATLALLEPSAPASDPRRAALLAVHERLCVVYGAPLPFFHDLDPLSELVASLLSHRTRNADTGRAFRALRALYPDWAALRDAPTDEVERAIAPVTWPEQKAPRIQRVLRSIAAARGELSLDFLADLTVRQARDWLESLDGVGPKTSAAVLLFSNLRRPALPVDSHHHRVARRLGLLPPRPRRRPRARLARGPLARRVGRARGLRSPRSVDAPRPALLSLPGPRVRPLPRARSLPHRGRPPARRRRAP